MPPSFLGWIIKELSSRLETGCDVAFSTHIREQERMMWTCRLGGSQVEHGQTWERRATDEKKGSPRRIMIASLPSELFPLFRL